jgi:hypothetical protein
MFAAVFACAVGAAAVQAQSPGLTEVFPGGGKRGTAVDAVFTGSNLLNPIAVISNSPCRAEIVAEAGKKSATAVPVRITIPADCPTDVFEFRIVTAGGISGPRMFSVDTLPELNEAEPNETPAAGQAVTLPAVINGRSSGTDVDCFKFTAKAGERIAFEAIVRDFGSGIDPVLTLYQLRDGRFVDIADNEQSPATAGKARFELVMPVDGTYVVEIREGTFKGVGGSQYRLRIGDFSAALAAYPSGGKRGSQVKVSAVGGPSSAGVEHTLTVPADAPTGRINVRIPDRHGRPAAQVPFAVGDFDEVLEVEPNNDVKKPQPIAATPVVINGRIQARGDVDCFGIGMKKGQTLVFKLDARRLDSPLDSVLTVADAAGKVLASNDDDGPQPDSRVSFTAPADGVFTVAVRDVNYRGGVEWVYRLTVSPARPDFSISVDADALSASPGGAALLVVTAARSNYTGPIGIEVVGLPEGVRLQPEPVIAAGQTTCLTTLVPGPGVRAAGSAVRVVGTAEADGVKLRRTATARIVYVPGGKGQPPLLSRETADLGFAVRGKSAYTIAAKSPELVVVPGMGATRIPVTMKRLEGAPDAVNLSAAGLPAGITVDPKTSNIAKGAAEGGVAVTVTDKAPPGKYTVAVTAVGPAPKVKGGGGGGPAPTGEVLEATPAFTLYVKRAFELSAAPPAITLAPEGAAEINVKLVRNGPFADAVNLTVAGLPAGVTAAAATIPKGADEAKIVLTAAKDAKPGSGKATVNGAAKLGAASVSAASEAIAVTVAK